MKYVVATTRIKKDGSVAKGAKRHALTTFGSVHYFSSLNTAKIAAKNISRNLYKVEIYTGNWGN